MSLLVHTIVSILNSAYITAVTAAKAVNVSVSFFFYVNVPDWMLDWNNWMQNWAHFNDILHMDNSCVKGWRDFCESNKYSKGLKTGKKCY